MAQAPARPETEAQMKHIKTMLLVGGLFVVVGYLLVGSALFFELTQFHPLLDDFFVTQTQHSVAGGGPDRGGLTGLNARLATIHAWPSTLLWLKLGGIAHILTGIFVALAAVVRVLSLMPVRLGSLMQEDAGTVESAAREGVSPDDD